MPYYNECPLCGSNLDPGESCDCQKEKQEVKNIAEDSDSNGSIKRGGREPIRGINRRVRLCASV